MDLAIIYIGISQALFGALLIFIKKPFNIADKILGSWLIVIACTFITNLVIIKLQIIDLWPVFVSLSLLFAPNIYLYSKYIIYEYPKFKKSDLIHLTPFFIAITILILNVPDTSSLKVIANYYSHSVVMRTILGNLYIISLWIYGLMALRNVIRYKKQMNDFYSFQSGKINLNWLLILIISHLLIQNFIIIISTIYYGKKLIPELDALRNGSLLLFAYALTIWGYRQTQLSSNIKAPKLNLSLNQEESSDSEKYKRSGLKKEQAIQYAEDLINYMNTTEVWKDTELNIKKLSEYTNIQSHFITQILNENLNKNFNTFVNEYRIEYAKELIKSSKYDSWSFLSISFESGFNSKATFNSFFKKQTGMTPSEYKKQNPPR